MIRAYRITQQIRAAFTRQRSRHAARNLQERTRPFAIAVVKFCRTLPKTDEAQDEARQLRRAASAVRRNYRAARRGRSRAEFEAKPGAVFEEADECVDCLQALEITFPLFNFSTFPLHPVLLEAALPESDRF